MRPKRLQRSPSSLVSTASAKPGISIGAAMRLLVGPNARLVLPISMLFGASLLAAADVVARMLGGIPVGVVTAVIGAPLA